MNRQRKTQLEYEFDHNWAKLVVALLVSGLLIGGHVTGYLFLDIIAVFVWIFGVNAIAYMIEAALHHKHKHGKL